MPRVRRCRYPGCHAMCQLPDHYCKQHYEHEAEYLASRQKWARSHNAEYQRKYNNVTRYRDDTKSAQYHFYKSKQWQSLRKQVLERDHYVCQYCGKPNSKTVDHVIPIEFDSKLQADTANLATICRDCHRLKTAWEQRHYGTGKDNQLIAGAEPIHDVDVIAKLITL